MKNQLKSSTILTTLFCVAFYFNACNSGSSTTAGDTTKMMKDTTSKGNAMTNQNQMKQDSQSIVALVTANYDEIKILQLTLTKAIPADLKTDVKKMLSDHQGSLKQLQELASKQNISIPTSADSAGVKEYGTLSRENGMTFQKDFLSFVITAHNDAIGKCQGIVSTSHDNDLVTWCTNTLPVLHEHLQMMQTAQNNLKSSS